MKKFLSILLAVSLLLTLSAFAADDIILIGDQPTDELLIDTTDLLIIEGDQIDPYISNFAGELFTSNTSRWAYTSMYGNITAVLESGSLYITNERNEEDSVIVHIGDTTLVIDAQTGLLTTLDEATEGDRVVAYYGPVATRSLPPQSNAAAILVNIPEGFSPYFTVVEMIERRENDLRVLVDNGGLYITIDENTDFSRADGAEMLPSDIGLGDALIVWYDMVAMSYPGQTTAKKAVVVRDGGDSLVLSSSAGVASVNGAELDLAGVNATEDGAPTYPLRQLCEAFGYDVRWIENTEFVEITRGETVINLEFGNAVVTVNGIDIALPAAPVVYSGVTYVTSDFFEVALGAYVVAINFGV